MRTVTLQALLACWSGDDAALLEHLRHLVAQAFAAGDQIQLDMLSEIVEIHDADRGDISLKPRPSS